MTEYFTQIDLPSPQERRLRNRQEAIRAILLAARQTIRHNGVAALNLNEVARMVHMQPPALYKYFPSKFAIYDALFQEGLRLFHEGDKQAWETPTVSGWEPLEAWFEIRLSLAEKHFDLYHLVFDQLVPGFTPSEESIRDIQRQLAEGLQAMSEMVAQRVLSPPMPIDEAFDFLLVLRRGIVAEHLGKLGVTTEATPDRFRRLVPHALAFLKSAWPPE